MLYSSEYEYVSKFHIMNKDDLVEMAIDYTCLGILFVDHLIISRLLYSWGFLINIFVFYYGIVVHLNGF